jgi:hypothetical protein
MRGGVGAIDPDSDMEPDIDVSATADTSTDRIKLDHRQFESKRRKSTHLQSAPEPPALPIDDPVEEVKKKQVINYSEICIAKLLISSCVGCIGHDGHVFTTL